MREFFLRGFLATAVVFVASAQSALTVINYAGFTGMFPVAPGSIASAYGDFGALATTSAATLDPLPAELAETRLRIASADAPLYFVSRGQINFVIPVSVRPGRHPVEVITGGSVRARGFVNVYDVGPGLASSDTTTARQGIIQNQDFSVNGMASRARRGQAIQLYATGCGATNPPLQDGRPPAGLSSTVAPVKAYVSVDEAPVQFAGAHPLFPGICQINVIVPAGGHISGQVPVYVTVNGVASNPVSFWVE